MRVTVMREMSLIASTASEGIRHNRNLNCQEIGEENRWLRIDSDKGAECQKRERTIRTLKGSSLDVPHEPHIRP
jgi:hypothetical protein